MQGPGIRMSGSALSRVFKPRKQLLRGGFTRVVVHKAFGAEAIDGL